VPFERGTHALREKRCRAPTAIFYPVTSGISHTAATKGIPTEVCAGPTPLPVLGFRGQEALMRVKKDGGLVQGDSMLLLTRGALQKRILELVVK
jgi:hypothetical protein